MPEEAQTVHFIITGGTIDSYYDVTKDTAVPNKTSAIPGYLEILKLYTPTEFTEVCMKDSRDITESDLEKLVETITHSSHHHFIVTHGTYTMSDTSRYLATHLSRKDATIVLTASMIPITGFVPSDAGFNLGFAFSQVLNLDPGIYVCMNGRTFAPEEVSKLISEGRFVSMFNNKRD